jgi:hypothetical protein
MAKIFSPPGEIPVPEIRLRDNWQEKEQEFTEKLKEWCQKRRPDQDGVGEVIQFPRADGYAVYMVAGTKPVELIHLPLGDAWEFEYAHRLTKKDIMEKIKQSRSLHKLFGK